MVKTSPYKILDHSLCGSLNAKTHCLSSRVYYAETDAGGVVYHAAYLNFAERARCEFLRALGYDVSALTRDHGLIFALRRCEIDYLAPAKLDDLLEIQSHIVKLGGASLVFRQVINKSVEKRTVILADLSVTLVAVNADGKPTRIPDFLRGALTPLVIESGE